MPPLKSNVKSELSTLANKIKTMSLNLWKTVNAQQEIVNKNVEFLQQNISYLQKELTSKNKTIKSLLEVHSALTKSLIKPIVNDFRILFILFIYLFFLLSWQIYSIKKINTVYKIK